MSDLIERLRAAVDGAVSEYWAQIQLPTVITLEPPPMLSWAEMLELMRRATPPKRVLLVAPDRVETVRSALDAWKARETDWAMLAELNAIEVRGDDDGVFVRDPDEGWLMPGALAFGLEKIYEKARFW